ncbi:MAG: class I SAM-dependent methyltransferase [Miltoncostaeaceae bacterium]
MNPDYGAFADVYARARPSYPDELFVWLASLVTTDSAWDCGTGSGQAARGLAAHFSRVIATDMDARQIEKATPMENVEFRVAPAERSGLPDDSVDLVSAATAMHWFDLPAFWREVERVVRPGGALAAWSYHGCVIEEPFTELFARFYRETLRPHFPDAVEMVDGRYEGLDLPGTPLAPPALGLAGRWTRDGLLDFIESWSGVREYRQQHGSDAMETIREEFDDLWGDPTRTRELRWPLFVRASRL